jgi:hypothetical protein
LYARPQGYYSYPIILIEWEDNNFREIIFSQKRGLNFTKVWLPRKGLELVSGLIVVRALRLAELRREYMREERLRLIAQQVEPKVPDVEVKPP